MPKRPGPAIESRRERLPAEQRRRDILAVATALLRTRHYADVSLDLVAKEAGVTRGLINHHFGTKRGLYIEVLRAAFDVNVLPVPDYVHGQTLAERLAFAVHDWLDQLEPNADLYLDSVRPQAGGDPDVLAVVEEARENASARIGAVVGLGPVDELPARQRALLRIIQAAGEAVLIQWFDQHRLDRAEAEELLLDVLRSGAERLLGEAALP